MRPITEQDIKIITNFKERRKKSGLTLRFVEENTDISNSYLSQLENGLMKNPSFQTVVELHNFYCAYELTL